MQLTPINRGKLSILPALNRTQCPRPRCRPKGRREIRLVKQPRTIADIEAEHIEAQARARGTPSDLSIGRISADPAEHFNARFDKPLLRLAVGVHVVLGTSRAGRIDRARAHELAAVALRAELIGAPALDVKEPRGIYAAATARRPIECAHT